MTEFYSKLKTIFENIPNKTNFLKDLGLNSSYSGFRYFMHGRRAEPTDSLLETIADEIEFEYVKVPIRKTPEGAQLKKQLQDEFLEELDSYTTKYEKDTARVYLKDFGGKSTVAAVSADPTYSEIVNGEISIEDLF